MPIQYQEIATHRGMLGTLTYTVDLISKSESLSRNDQQPVMTMSEMLACGQSAVTFPSPVPGKTLSLTFDEIKEAFAGTDFDNSVITANIRFQPDPTRNPPRYPSDMIEELRNDGTPEEKIQELLEWEHSVRGS